MDEPSDHDLLRRMGSGDASAFEALYRRRQGAVYRFALQMTGSAALAEDVVQDVFLVLMRDVGAFDPAKGSVAAFLFGIARNHVLRRLRREHVPPDDGPEQAAPEDHPEAAIVRGELIASVRAAVLSLPVHYREVVVLCELQEAGYAEAAAALNCSVGTVRSRLHRARQLLAARLSEYRGRQPFPQNSKPAGCSI